MSKELKKMLFLTYLRGFVEGARGAGIALQRELGMMPKCKYCGSENVVRYGTHNGVQYWWCKDCKRKYADNEALPKMQTPVDQVAAALSMYYGGMSINAIRRHLEQHYDNKPSDSTVYGWIVRFSQLAVNAVRDCQPDVGDTWVADETVVKIGGKNVWFWDIIDSKTRYLLASYLSLSRTANDAYNLMRRAAQTAGKTPKVVITDQLLAYLDGIEIAFGAETKHIAAKGLTAKRNTNLIERFHGSLKDRLKVMCGLKMPETANLLLQGWLVHYNYFRPHRALSGQTPAQKAGIALPLKSWADVVYASKDWADAPKEARMLIVGSVTPDGYAKHKYRRPVQRRKAAQQAKGTTSASTATTR